MKLAEQHRGAETSKRTIGEVGGEPEGRNEAAEGRVQGQRGSRHTRGQELRRSSSGRMGRCKGARAYFGSRVFAGATGIQHHQSLKDKAGSREGRVYKGSKDL